VRPLVGGRRGVHILAYLLRGKNCDEEKETGKCVRKRKRRNSSTNEKKKENITFFGGEGGGGGVARYRSLVSWE
jgi:hypothetical protein